jgi:acyl carrier protein
MSVRSTVVSQFEQVAAEQDRKLAPLTDDLPLTDTGLDSLCFAIVVDRLQDALGVDPFSDAEEASLPTTVGGFIRLYEDAAE